MTKYPQLSSKSKNPEVNAGVVLACKLDLDDKDVNGMLNLIFWVFQRYLLCDINCILWLFLCYHMARLYKYWFNINLYLHHSLSYPTSQKYSKLMHQPIPQILSKSFNTIILHFNISQHYEFPQSNSYYKTYPTPTPCIILASLS